MTLHIELDKTQCQPGDLLKGTVFWESDTRPTKLTLEVSWQTSGKGSDDSDIVFTEDWTPDAKSGERKFQFQLPRGPISVRGNLISIGWQVECISKRPKESAGVSFVLSHMGQPVQLSSVVG